MSTWKLQKLCYYSQAWHYTWTDSLLFKKEFQAWRNGPVCPVLFYAHQGKYIIDFDDIASGDQDALTAEEKESVDIVLQHYSSWEPYELKEQTHYEDPWKLARGGLPENAHCQNVITPESMGIYYGGL